MSLNIEHYLSFFNLFPKYQSNETINKEQLAKFVFLLFSAIISNFKYGILIFNYKNSFWSYFLGDTTFAYGNAQDYLLICIYFWSLTMVIGLTSIIQFYWRKETRWIIGLTQKIGRKSISQNDKIIDEKVDQKLKLCIFWSKIILIFSDVGYILFSYAYLSFKIDYILTIGLFWFIHGLTICSIMTNMVDFGVFMFALNCYRIRLLLDEMRNKIDTVFNRNFFDEQKMIQQIILDYAAMRKEIYYQNLFWKRISFSVLLGCAGGFSFQLYNYFFVHLDWFTLTCITLWGSLALFNGILLNMLAPSNARKGVKFLLSLSLFCEGKVLIDLI